MGYRAKIPSTTDCLLGRNRSIGARTVHHACVRAPRSLLRWPAGWRDLADALGLEYFVGTGACCGSSQFDRLVQESIDLGRCVERDLLA